MAMVRASQRAAPVDARAHPARYAHPRGRVGGAAVTLAPATLPAAPDPVAPVRRRVLLASAQIGHTLARITPTLATDLRVLRALAALADAACGLAAAVASAERDARDEVQP
jgi:hypothetical protein